jgi:hypothetical protein
MNMIPHDFTTANIVSGNTPAAPKFKNGEQLRSYDCVVANPPFSDKSPTWRSPWFEVITMASTAAGFPKRPLHGRGDHDPSRDRLRRCVWQQQSACQK